MVPLSLLWEHSDYMFGDVANWKKQGGKSSQYWVKLCQALWSHQDDALAGGTGNHNN